MEKGFVSDGVYVGLGQFASAVGTLVGVRLLTEVVDQSVFGEVALIMGVVGLVQGVSSLGLAQAVLRMYPECARNATLDLLLAVSSSTLWKWLLWLASAMGTGCLIYSVATRGSVWLTVLVPGLLITESVRLYHVTLLNAARRQPLMALWMGTESWVRAGCALAAVFAIGANADAVLGGFFVGTGVLWLSFVRAVERSVPGQAVSPFRLGWSSEKHEEFCRIQTEVIRYTRPLFPLGLVGWLSGQADRYIIGGFLGLASAGQYAATYGLVSRPFLMIGASVELIFRQFLYEAVSSGDLGKGKRVLAEWLGIIGVFGILGVVGFSVFSSRIADVLLAEPYRETSHLMPWIAAGYLLFLLAQVVERICYAAKDTDSVLIIQCSGAALSILVSTIGVAWFGLVGAAGAVPVYFGLQLCVALALGYRSARNHLVGAATKRS